MYAPPGHSDASHYSQAPPNEIDKLHENIRQGKLKDVCDFVQKFPDEKVCNNSNGISALEIAIQLKRFQIYSFLVSEGFTCDNEESLQQIIKELSKNEKSYIRCYNRKHFKECPEKILNILASKFEFFVTVNKLNSSETRKVLENLREIEGAVVLMTILAQSDVTIATDMKNRHICKMNPLKEETFGSANPSIQTIYLANTENKHDWAVTFIHEMTHYVCRLIYENAYLPYCKHDFEGEKEFDEIFQGVKIIYEHNQAETEIISDIFEAYTENNVQKGELIARVPHILAFYHQNPEKLKDLQDKYSRLFNFYRTKFLYELQIENVYQMIKLNNDFGLLDSIENSKWQANSRNDLQILTKDQKRILLVSKIPQLAFSKAVQELKQNSVSALNFKARNIFIDVKKLEFFSKELGNLIESFCIEKVVVDLTNYDPKFISKTLENYMSAIGHLQCIFVADENQVQLIEQLKKKLNFQKQDISFHWKDLSEDAQKLVKDKKVTFQGQKIKIEELFDKPQNSLTSNALKVVYEKSEIDINCELSKQNWENFIPRIIEEKTENFEFETSDDEKKSLTILDKLENYFIAKKKKKVPESVNFKYTEHSTTDFILNSRRADNFQNFVLFSDPAGSGKTFLFKKLCDDLKNAENEIQKQAITSETSQNDEDKNKLIFPLFLPLKSHLEELKKFTDEGQKSAEEKFVNFVAEMANLDGLTKAVFSHKFSKGQTIIFFDAFDEISPICKEKTEKLFKLFQKTLDGAKRNNQIFISTRTHLEAELERKFGIWANKIKVLTKDQQIQFLKNVWQKPNLDQALIESCAGKLVQKITNLIESMSSMIGVPIVLSGLAEFYYDKIGLKTEAEIEDLSISKVFQKITVDKPLEVFKERHPEINADSSSKTKSPTETHQFFAVKFFFNKKMATNLGLTHYKKDWPLEEIARYGIATFQNEDDIFFNHQTYAEFLVALKLFELLRDVENLSDSQKDFLVRIFTEEKFKVSRLFLDSKLEEAENYEELELKGEEIYELLRPNSKLLNEICYEELFCVFDFLLSSIFKNDKKLFKNLVEGDFYRNFQYFRRRVLIFTKNEKKLGNFLRKVYEAKINFEDFLTGRYEDGENILHKFAQHSSYQMFEVFWVKCEEFIANEEKLKEIFTQKDNRGQHLLQFSLRNKNDPKMFEKMFNLAATKVFKGNLKEFERLIFERDPWFGDGQNIFTIVIQFGNTETIKILFEKVEEVFGVEKVQEFLRIENYYGENLLVLGAWNNSKESNEVLWEIFEEKFSREEVCKILLQKNRFGENTLHSVLARYSNTIKKLEFLSQKIIETFKYEKNSRKLLFERKFSVQKMMTAAFESISSSDEIFLFVFEKIYCKSFPNVENFIYEVDKNGENFFHKLVQNGEVMSLKFGLEKIKEKLRKEKFAEFLEFKNNFGENCFHLIRGSMVERFQLMGDLVKNENGEERMEFLTDFVRIEFGEEKLQKMLSEKTILPHSTILKVKDILFFCNDLKLILECYIIESGAFIMQKPFMPHLPAKVRKKIDAIHPTLRFIIFFLICDTFFNCLSILYSLLTTAQLPNYDSDSIIDTLTQSGIGGSIKYIIKFIFKAFWTFYLASLIDSDVNRLSESNY